MLEKYNELTGQKLESNEECLAVLEALFQEKYEELEDAQLAYDDLAKEYPFIQEHLCFEIVSWKLSIEDTSNEDEIVESFNEYYDTTCETIFDVIQELELKIYDTMCNVGCDQETAFNSIAQDVYLDDFECEHLGYRLCSI